jgi:hypothetical protein
MIGKISHPINHLSGVNNTIQDRAKTDGKKEEWQKRTKRKD